MDVPWLVKWDVDNSPGIIVFDMDTDPKGNIYCYLGAGDLETKLDTSWFIPSVKTFPKMAKFNPDGYLEWMREMKLTRTFSFYPNTSSNSMYVDRYGNSYYSFLLPNDFQGISIDSIKFSQPYSYGDLYWGLVKLDTDGKAVDALFPPMANKKDKVSFNNSLKQLMWMKME
jgi:hypothetical protein